MNNKSNWYGIECEGRYQGLFTYFVRYSIGSKINKKTQHIYFTKEYLSSNSNAEIIESIAIENKYIVSVEVNKKNWKYITPNIRVRCHLIYRIIDSIPFELKQNDSIFIDSSTMYNVLCYTKCNALIVKPEDYSKDYL